MILPIGNQIPLSALLPRVTYYAPKFNFKIVEKVKKPRSRADMLFGVNGVECQHEHFDSNNQCDNCGFECSEHEYKTGKSECHICGYECEHFDHDGHSCLECGLECYEFLDFDSAYEGDR